MWIKPIPHPLRGVPEGQIPFTFPLINARIPFYAAIRIGTVTLYAEWIKVCRR